jgi:endonuclease/exonuclease/phosphatase family metal-dependent hydrolase
VLWAAIEIGDATLQLVNTHLGVTARERTTQVETLLGPQWLGHPDCRDPVILAGDFNAPPRGRTCWLLAAKVGESESADLLDGNLATFPSRVPVLGSLID